MEAMDDHISLDVNDPSLPPTPVAKSKSQSSLSSQDSSRACIYRIPKYFHEKAKGGYTPRVISIGPYHHGKEWLTGMDAVKKRYLEEFLTRSQKSKEEFMAIIKDKEEKLRDCYFEPSAMDSNDLAEIVLQDAAFIFELLYRCCYSHDYINDRLLGSVFMLDLIKIDMLMLENQLPIFILEELVNFANIQAPEDLEEDRGGLRENEKICMLKLAYIFFKEATLYMLYSRSKENINLNDVLHFLDLVRACHVPLHIRMTENEEDMTENEDDSCHVLENFPSVTELHQAGVKFRKVASSNLFDIKFDAKTGVLHIPCFTLSSKVKFLLQNMPIFEEFHYNGSELLINYVKFLDYLVNTPRDAEILVQNQIVLNRLGDNSAVADFLNYVAQDMSFYHQRFYFYGICKELSSYYKDPRHRLIANLKQNYFNTPWVGISVVAAAVLLVANLLQTVFTIIK